MKYLKRMLGIVVGLLCTLVVAGLCSYCFNIDLKWYISLNKPSFLVSNGWFTFFVCASYISSILAVGRLVEYKHIFPSMIFFGVMGIGCILFVLCFFTFKNLIASLIFISLVLAMAYVLFVRFLIKDYKMALEFLPAFLFDVYAFVCVMCIALQN
ncbi:MAG: tryptophan-rich sensory protein [Bacteroides sp.]|nr:tryptophan-rich sensory protein [Bacillota bacterium]MCM1393569.1 tryptophan-rich sensory protein [[Eubacterium] siraeum]MCM1455012.1 tryptophan-rich sensory protein [Bacteroides sp.]